MIIKDFISGNPYGKEVVYRVYDAAADDIRIEGPTRLIINSNYGDKEIQDIWVTMIDGGIIVTFSV